MSCSSHLESKILYAMEEYFAGDTLRILHAHRVLQYAKEILEEEGGNREIIIPAAILHDIGIKECETKYNSSNGQLQEKEGPPIAGKILQGFHMNEAIISEVCQIISSHHSPGELNSLNFKILWDADWLVNLKDEYDIRDKKKLKNVIEKIFFTESGKIKAREIYIKNENQ